MITLYGTPRSRVLRVSWLLEELGLNWEFCFLNFAEGDNRSESYLAMNPSGKMPVLKDGDIVLTESAAIMQYLSERYGEGAFLPAPGTALAAQHHRWVSFIITELEQPLWSMGKHKFALPENLRLVEMLAVAKYEFDKAAEIAEQWIPERGFLLGDTITNCDILLAQTLMWATLFEQDIPPKMAAFRDRLQHRPALASALQKTQAIAKAAKEKIS
ncbi:glutathione S-transferase family protein [Shewanella intestini]|uniref:Glutathione S-transferase family protein n=1 Tax=Shewanella intestini TaxID=2017544 RepID=A0ABS5I3A6_9GAMM|nr:MULTISPECIES: glutathione S-transferase family protein [Shewanella]MBR9728509.1 glutathione S-transferase family protein [Shewanella intestini]MRG36328.1 glutathione S-transferase family protein [Shewanella sp. XMDDZSB0408]